METWSKWIPLRASCGKSVNSPCQKNKRPYVIQRSTVPNVWRYAIKQTTHLPATLFSFKSRQFVVHEPKPPITAIRGKTFPAFGRKKKLGRLTFLGGGKRL